MNRKECKGCPAEYEPCLEDSFGDRPAHLIVVGPAPSGFSIGQNQAFYGRHGRLFKQLLDIIRQYNGGMYAGVKAHFTYAAMVGAYEPKASHLEHCKPIMQRHIRKVSGFGARRPVLVPLGPVPAKALGLRFRKITEIVGRELSVDVAGDSYTVVPLLSMRHLEAKIGVANVILSALLKAVSIAYGDKQKDVSLDELTKDYVYPSSIVEVRELVDHIINYYNPEHGNGPEQWAISLDTETNTLKPFSHPDPKVLMISAAWDDKKAATILLDHPEVPYDPAEAWEEVGRLLSCPKPKCFHNWKFDKKFLETVYGYRVNRVTWDTLLGEHYIDEDKKGHYSLKQLTPIYCPQYEGYDDELHQILRGHEDQETDEEDDFEEDGALPLLLSDKEILERNEKLGCPDDRASPAWIALVGAIDERQAIKKIKRKDRTPEQQRRFTDLKKEIDQARTAMNIMAPQKKKTKQSKGKKDEGFANIPLSTILQYAAVDADVTRIILRAQVRRIQRMDDWEDGKRVMKYLYLPGTKTLSGMEYRGFKIDTEHQNGLINDVQIRINDVKSYIAREFDPSLNLNAPHQISEYMSKLNFESLPGEEVGGTGKDILAKYEKKYPEDDPRHVFVTKLLEYREASKVMTTYLRPYSRLAKADGKIHCQFNLNGTATGRLCVAGETQLVTSHGTFAIAKFPTKLLGKAKIKTHRGRWRRITKKYYKGTEKMYRVTLSDGSQITCTRGHRFLTPNGWKSLHDTTIEEQGGYICTPRPTHTGAATGAFGEEFCTNSFERGFDRRGSTEEVQFQSPHLAQFDERVQEEVRKENKGVAIQTLRQVKVGQSIRTEGKAGCSSGKGTSGRYVAPQNGTVPDSRGVGCERLVCAGEHQAARPEPHRQVAHQNAEGRPGVSGTPGTVLSWNHCPSTGLLRKPTPVLPEAVQSLHSPERAGVVCEGTSSSPRILRGERCGSSGPHLLVSQPRRDAVVSGSAREEGTPHSTVHLPRELCGRLCVSGDSAVGRSRRRLPSEGHGNQASRQTESSKGTGAGVQGFALHRQGSLRRPSTRSTVHSSGIACITKIECVGCRPVWDIEVEEDHSYEAQGFINHNSSARPNLQNVPYIAARRTKKNDKGEEVVVHPGYNIKKLFVPSREGDVIVNVDIKGAELRVYTAYSKDQLMIGALNKGMDVHSLVTSRVYKIPYEEVNAKKETDPDIKEKRTRCKRTVFGTFYGAGPFKIAQQINSTKEEAEQLQTFLFTEFPAIRNYVDEVRHEIDKYQMVGTFFGRKRRFRLAHVNQKNRAEAIREAVNFKIQSTSADLVLSQMCEMDDHFDELDAEMLITVHDSMTFQMPRTNLHLLHDFLDKWIVERVAEKYDWLPVPFLYDVEVGPSYGEVKPFERKDVHAQEKATG